MTTPAAASLLPLPALVGTCLGDLALDNVYAWAKNYAAACVAHALAGQWIAVDVCRPTNRSRVLVYFPTESTSPMDALYDGENFIVDGIVRTHAVTHWMPAPKEPS